MVRIILVQSTMLANEAMLFLDKTLIASSQFRAQAQQAQSCLQRIKWILKWGKLQALKWKLEWLLPQFPEQEWDQTVVNVRIQVV